MRHREPGPEAALRRFPTRMWRNREVWDFADWMRGHNAGLPAGERAEFRGLDVYGLGGSIHAVLRYLDEVDPAELSGQFDGFVWFEETTAVTPLPAPERAEEEPDLFASGV